MLISERIHPLFPASWYDTTAFTIGLFLIRVKRCTKLFYWCSHQATLFFKNHTRYDCVALLQLHQNIMVRFIFLSLFRNNFAVVYLSPGLSTSSKSKRKQFLLKYLLYIFSMSSLHTCIFSVDVLVRTERGRVKKMRSNIKRYSFYETFFKKNSFNTVPKLCFLLLYSLNICNIVV